jgi:hypothetical protein
MNQRLFVGNLAFQTTEEDLRSAFEAHGSVVEAKIITDRETGRSRGFGFLTMGTGEEAQRAIEAMNGVLIDGRALRVNEAEEKRPRAGGGGGGLATVRAAVAVASAMIVEAAALATIAVDPAVAGATTAAAVDVATGSRLLSNIIIVGIGARLAGSSSSHGLFAAPIQRRST